MIAKVILSLLTSNVSAKSCCEADRLPNNDHKWYCILEGRKYSKKNYYCALYQEIIPIIFIESIVTAGKVRNLH
jgi:hypothetical protein